MYFLSIVLSPVNNLLTVSQSFMFNVICCQRRRQIIFMLTDVKLGNARFGTYTLGSGIMSMSV